ncbi:MAG: hypothetical protein Q8J85_07145 [Sulfuricurvum sp.]|nr:hypothetical protein [Sulfuricurvum sp.]MDP3022998.1 hypothetical protein [Sulfuricurvum sp.]
MDKNFTEITVLGYNSKFIVNFTNSRGELIFGSYFVFDRNETDDSRIWIKSTELEFDIEDDEEEDEVMYEMECEIYCNREEIEFMCEYLTKHRKIKYLTTDLENVYTDKSKLIHTFDEESNSFIENTNFKDKNDI